MRRGWKRVLLAALPVAGLSTLTAAWVRVRTLPTHAAQAALQARLAELQQARAALMAQAPASPDELTDRLPRTLTVGALLQRIETAARQAGVRAVSFGSDEVGPAAGGRAPSAAQRFAEEAEAEREAGEVHGTVAVVPERLRCQITVEADYGALVEFLGLMETMPAATRVHSLQIVPRPQGVSATVGFEGYAYAGDGREATLPAAPATEVR